MLVRVLSMPARGRPTASQWPVTRAPQKHFDVQARVAVCEHVRWWRGSHTRAACVSSVFWTRVIVCEAQSSERERGTRGRGSGRPGAPTCLFVGKWESVTRFATELCLPVEKADIAPPSNVPTYNTATTPRPLLRAAAVCAAPCALLQPPQRHGAQKNDAIRKSQEAAKQNGSLSSFSAQGRNWHTRSFFRDPTQPCGTLRQQSHISSPSTRTTTQITLEFIRPWDDKLESGDW